MISERKHWWRSFAGGEISPEMYGRFDLAKNQTGLERCYNFLITPQGVLEKRSGTEYIAVGASNLNARLETFTGSDGRGFLLEITHLNTRIFLNGALVDEVGTPWNTDALPTLTFAQFVNDMSVASVGYTPRFIRRVSDTNWISDNIVFNATLAAPTSVLVAAHEISSMDPGDPRITYQYVVTATDANGAESAPSVAASNDNVLRIAGNNNTITWAAVAGTFRYNVYCARGNGSFGFVGSADGLSFVDDNINPDQETPPPSVLATFSGASNYPKKVAFHDQRFLLANTTDDPQSFWASGLPNFEYFKASVPPQDDQAFTYQLATKKAAPIRHMLALRDLLFFTENGVHRVYDATGNGFAPGNVGSIQVSAHGAVEYIAPQEAGNAVLFPAARGNHLLALKYDGSGEGYATDDMSIVAPHLIDGYTWRQTALQRSPFPVWWGLRSDGRVLGLTYVGEQQVAAWFQLDIGGNFVQSIAVVPEGDEDALYCLVRRFIDGDSVTYIERVKPRFGPLDAQQDAFFVDCGKTYSGVATQVITGLEHLEGEEVVALAEGQPMGPYTVMGGQITIDELSSLVHVGKSYAAEAETLPLAYEAQAVGVGAEKNVSAVHFRLKRSEGVEAGPSFDRLRPLAPQATELIGNIIPLRDGVHAVDIDQDWNQDGRVVIRQDLPLPATITSMAMDFVAAD